MKISFKKWTAIFFSVIGLAVGLELIAVFTKTGDYMPLTWYIVNYIPAELGMFLITGFSGWLIYHFAKRYWSKK